MVSLFALFSEFCNSLGSGTKFFLCCHAAVVTLKGFLRESFSLSLANVLWWNLVLSFINSLLVL